LLVQPTFQELRDLLSQLHRDSADTDVDATLIAFTSFHENGRAYHLARSQDELSEMKKEGVPMDIIMMKRFQIIEDQDEWIAHMGCASSADKAS